MTGPEIRPEVVEELVAKLAREGHEAFALQVEQGLRDDLSDGEVPSGFTRAEFEVALRRVRRMSPSERAKAAAGEAAKPHLRLIRGGEDDEG